MKLFLKRMRDTEKNVSDNHAVDVVEPPQESGPRTNNHLEGWHYRLNRLARKKHPNHEVIEIIKQEQAATLNNTFLHSVAHLVENSLLIISP